MIAAFRAMSDIGAMKPVTPLRKASRELFAIAAIGSVGLTYLGVIWETRPPSLMSGRVIGFGLVEQDGFGQVGSTLRAQVELPGHRLVSVPLPNGSLCKAGSRIEIEEAHTLFGSRFRAGLRECSVSA